MGAFVIHSSHEGTTKRLFQRSLQQILDCDRQLFALASHHTMGRLTAATTEDKPLDTAIKKLKESQEVLQYLSPLPAKRQADPPPKEPPVKKAKVQSETENVVRGPPKKGGISIPDGCA